MPMIKLFLYCFNDRVLLVWNIDHICCPFSAALPTSNVDDRRSQKCAFTKPRTRITNEARTVHQKFQKNILPSSHPLKLLVIPAIPAPAYGLILNTTWCMYFYLTGFIQVFQKNCQACVFVHAFRMPFIRLLKRDCS